MERNYAFIVDLDGTLIDSNEFWANLVKDYASGFDTASLCSINYDNGVKNIANFLNTNSKKVKEDLDAKCIDFYTNKAMLQVGAIEFLNKFKNYEKCILTSSPFAKIVLEKFNILNEFKFIQDESEFLKSDERAFLLCKSRLKANKIILIDDSKNPINTANNCGILTVGINCENAKINIKNIGELNEKDIKYSWK